jgi:hypothetical protein
MMILVFASPASGQSVLWVAGNGSDANPCSQTAPCATFQGAINKGGVTQINCLTSGSYGAVTITASITIDCGTGNIGQVIPGDTTSGITISSGTPANIVLRHLSINGRGATSPHQGIDATNLSSGTLTIEDCMIQGFHGGQGITFGPSAGRGTLQVSYSLVFDNMNGIFAAPSVNRIATLTLNHVELIANQNAGLSFSGLGTVAGTMRNSVSTGNGQWGVVSIASQVFFTVEESSITANLAFGIQTSFAGSVLNVGNSTIGANGTGLSATQGSSIISFGNNQMSANGSNGNFTSTTSLR